MANEHCFDQSLVFHCNKCGHDETYNFREFLKDPRPVNCHNCNTRLTGADVSEWPSLAEVIFVVDPLTNAEQVMILNKNDFTYWAHVPYSVCTLDRLNVDDPSTHTRTEIRGGYAFPIQFHCHDLFIDNVVERTLHIGEHDLFADLDGGNLQACNVKIPVVEDTGDIVKKRDAWIEVHPQRFVF